MSDLELLSLVRRARLEYEEMPGLALTIPQAARLWRLEPRVVEHVMAALVDAEFLCLGRSGFILRAPEQRVRNRRMTDSHRFAGA
jgi:hypothetical protein